MTVNKSPESRCFERELNENKDLLGDSTTCSCIGIGLVKHGELRSSNDDPLSSIIRFGWCTVFSAFFKVFR